MNEELRQVVLKRALAEGPQYAGSGYGAVYEEMMLAYSAGQFVLIERGGVAYMAITQKGIDAIEVAS